MKIAPSLRLDSAGRLILLRQLDPLRKWESLDDRRFCRCCNKFISGREVEVISASRKPLRLVCPTTDCSSNIRDWVYPNEIAQPPDAWGRRVLRVIAYGSNPQTAKFSKRETLSMSWIHEMVDGHDLSEVLRHQN